jgi:hypothetical protein
MGNNDLNRAAAHADFCVAVYKANADAMFSQCYGGGCDYKAYAEANADAMLAQLYDGDGDEQENFLSSDDDDGDDDTQTKRGLCPQTCQEIVQEIHTTFKLHRYTDRCTERSSVPVGMETLKGPWGLWSRVKPRPLLQASSVRIWLSDWVRDKLHPMKKSASEVHNLADMLYLMLSTRTDKYKDLPSLLWYITTTPENECKSFICIYVLNKQLVSQLDKVFPFVETFYASLTLLIPEEDTCASV